MTPNLAKQWDRVRAQLSVEEYQRRISNIDQTYAHIFGSESSGQLLIEPRFFIIHETQVDDDDRSLTAEQALTAMLNREGNCCSVNFYIGHDALIYQTLPSISTRSVASGSQTNPYSVQVEVEARCVQSQTEEPLCGDGPFVSNQQLESLVYLATYVKNPIP